jgi:rSAM/selenodomain-associated transferase 2
MNAGAAAARGAIYLFLHADTRLPAAALLHVRHALTSPGVAAGAFRLGIDAPAKAYRVIEAMVSLRSRFLQMPYGDQAIFIKSGEFHRLGGFREIPLMEDVDLIQRLKKAGKRIVILPQRVRTSPRRWEKEGIVFCTLRNWALMTLYLMGWPPERLAAYYK